MNVTDHIRKNLYNRLGITDQPKRDHIVMTAEIKGMTNKLEEILSLAKPRLIMGGIRYGSEWNHDSLMNYIQHKFDLYKKDGNYEYLIDVINLIIVEGKIQTHLKYHFEPEDRKD